MDADTQIIYEELKEVARARLTCFYEDLFKLINLSSRSRRLYQILDSINLHEHKEGRPLLSALVGRKGYRISGSGFFRQAKELGRHDGSSGDATVDVTFWVDEVHRVWDYWKNY